MLFCQLLFSPNQIVEYPQNIVFKLNLLRVLEQIEHRPYQLNQHASVLPQQAGILTNFLQDIQTLN
jgi:hypothetical protein